jgi:hypothetical protein
VTFAASGTATWNLSGGSATAGSSSKACASEAGPPQFGPIGISASQTLRLLVAGNAWNQCEATVSFLDRNGAAVGPAAQTLTPAAGRSAYLDLAGNTLGLSTGQRATIRPEVSYPNDTARRSCQAYAEVFATATGLTAFQVQQQRQPTYYVELPPLGMAPSQSIRLAVTNRTGGSCTATLGFVDLAGNAVGGSSSASPSGSATAFLDLASTQVSGLSGWTGHADIRPRLLNATADCVASAEIFDTFTGATRINVVPGLTP